MLRNDPPPATDSPASLCYGMMYAVGMASETTRQSKSGVLVAQTVTTVNFTVPAGRHAYVRIIEGQGPVFFTVDGTEPTIGGDRCYVTTRDEQPRMVRIHEYNDPRGDTQTIKMICLTSPDYHIEVTAV